MSRTAGIVLAAGESRRMGRPKALLPWRGSTFLEIVVTQLGEAGLDPILVVIGAHAELTMASVLLANAQWIDNPEWTAGQSRSLRQGVAHLPSDVSAAVIALVDQPQIDTELIRRLQSMHTQTGAPVVRPVWNGRGGHPLLLGSEVFPRVLTAGPAETTFDMLQDFRTRTIDVEVEDDSILIDFDTPEDLARNSSRFGEQF